MTIKKSYQNSIEILEHIKKRRQENLNDVKRMIKQCNDNEDFEQVVLLSALQGEKDHVNSLEPLINYFKDKINE